MEMSERHRPQKERRSLKKRSILKGHQPISVKRQVLGSKDLGFYVFRTLICIVGKPWSKQCVYFVLDFLKVGLLM